ncbi:MAG: hypothetical protein M1813_007067 [Trichoglossum hirsutum]|nr:MAG: hypothetical protein M1813_007067 [Trichoglossum hirsutum]
MELMSSGINPATVQESLTLRHCLRRTVACRTDRSQYYLSIVGKTKKGYAGEVWSSQGKEKSHDPINIPLAHSELMQPQGEGARLLDRPSTSRPTFSPQDKTNRLQEIIPTPPLIASHHYVVRSGIPANVSEFPVHHQVPARLHMLHIMLALVMACVVCAPKLDRDLHPIDTRQLRLKRLRDTEDDLPCNPLRVLYFAAPPRHHEAGMRRWPTYMRSIKTVAGSSQGLGCKGTPLHTIRTA